MLSINDIKEKYFMGTRGFIGFVVDGVEKVAYNHFDSYPSGLGEQIRAWLHGLNSEERELVANQARVLRVVSPDSTPTDEDIEGLGVFADMNVGTRGDRPDWYQLLRKTQGQPALMLGAGVIENASHFPADSLFAEWGYVIDFDHGMLEIYRGFQHAPHTEGRFAGREALNNGYYPVKLIHRFPLHDLPATQKEFLAAVDPEEVEE